MTAPPAAPGSSSANPAERPWSRLADLPRSLWLPALVLSTGPAPQRLADSVRWRESLAQAQLPGIEADFGDAQALAPLRDALLRLGLPALCQGAPAMAEQVMRTLLWHLDRLVDHQPRLSRSQAIAQVAADFAEEWTVQKGDWETVQRLLMGLGDLANLRWDQVAGLLNRREWAEAERISQRLATMPEISALIRRIGRREHAPRAPLAKRPPPTETSALPPVGLREITTVLPDRPGEVHGIRHTDRLDRLLGSEAAQIRHPVLHKLWRARRAEGRLLGYDSQAVLSDWRPDPQAPPRAAAAPAVNAPLERGPILLCLDTSGSMRGGPENMAKAVALEAFRTAHREGRGCKLIAFGGPGELIEHDLSLDAQGLEALLALMGQTFDGGTDVQQPIERAIAAVSQQRWSGADLLIVSDGEFGCTPATLNLLDEAREHQGLRVQGVLVGDRETLGLMELCDEIHWVRDWRRHGERPGLQSFSPVHSKSLTALYFPNALSPRAARHKPAR